MRKLFTFFSVLLATTALWAYNFQSGNLYYNITSDSTVAVTYQEYNSSSNYASIYTVTVPETITYDGTTYSVTSIGQYAFYDCSSLTSVTIPNSVTSIERWAFSGCSSLTSITIPNSVTSIGSNAFYGCSSLTSITIPESVTYIGGDAFSYCRSLTAITIPESVTDIGSGAFESCSSLTSVVWNAKKCGNRNSYNDGYTHFYFEIEFADSTSYSYEEIDEFVKHFHLDEGNIINDSPFNGCDAIKSFSFGENVEFIPDGLCYGLDSITSITIPKSVWIIGERSFGSCGSLDTIYCYSEDFPVIRLTYLDVVVNMEMIFSYDADAPYIYDNTILYVPCQLLDAYKSQDEYSIRFPNIQCLEEETPSQPQDQPTEGIGVFSIGEGKTVTFSRGNLQYTQSTQTWSFAENQYDYLGTANVSNGALADKIDLFGWSASNTTAPFGVSTSTDWENGYSGSFIDWGTNKIGNDAPNTWRTLTYDEWYYLRYNRTNADNLVGVAQVNGVNGLILLPDNWTCPAGVTFKSGFHSSNGVEYYAAYQTFTADQWSKFEAAGAVFLPAAGDRGGSNLGIVQRGGFYWSATEHYSYYADYLYFYSDEARMFYSGYRHGGQSVRLVKDVNSTTPEPPVEPETEWITIYIDTVICEYDLPFNWHVGDHTMILCETAGTYTHEEIVEDENYIYHYIFTLELTVIPFSSDTIVVEAYDSYEWHGKVYTESGTYIYRNFCSIEVLELTIIDTPTPSEPQDTTIYHPVDSITICENELPYIWHGNTYDQGGTYTVTEIVEEGNTVYHHIYTLDLTIYASEVWTMSTIYETICENELPFVWEINGHSIVMDGTDSVYVYKEIDGCTVFIYTFELRIQPSERVVLVEEAYDSYVWHDTVYTESGTYTYQYECTTEILHLTIIDTPSQPQDTTIYYPMEQVIICEGDIFEWYSYEFGYYFGSYSDEGTYEYVLIEETEEYIYHHIFTLVLTVEPIQTTIFEVEAEESYEWHGKVYTESGAYQYWMDLCEMEELHLTIVAEPTDLTNPSTEQDTIHKLLRDGQLYIYHNGSAYTIMGQKVSENF